MARNVGTVVQNTFEKGFITEATGLNFPEDGSTDALNVVFKRIGSVRRRGGFDIEPGATTLAYTTATGVVQEYLWQTIADAQSVTYLALQLGGFVYLMRVDSQGLVSSGPPPKTVELSTYLAAGGGDINTIPVSFASGFGYLFIAHPSCDPIIVRWEDSINGFQSARIAPLVRDYKGLDDGLAITENPSSLSSKHHYNLRNQGWNKQVMTGSVNNEQGAGGSLGGSSTPPDLLWLAL